jgi:hypothetical protein
VSKFLFAHSNQEKIMSERSRTPLLLSFAGGAAAAALVMAALAYRKFDKANGKDKKGGLFQRFTVKEFFSPYRQFAFSLA